MTPIVLRRIAKRGWALTNCCWYNTKDGVPMAGSTFCKCDCNAILAFPTEVMRNTFFENFKDLIETCKEFL